MRFLLLCGLWLLTAGTVTAFTSEMVEPSAPYEPFIVSEPASAARVYLGELEGYPDMYEIASTEAFTLSLALATLPNSEPIPALSVIIVEVNESGVAEQARLPYVVGEWEAQRQSVTGLTLVAGPTYEEELPAGLYRIEISSPDNLGKYLLTLGNESAGAGYFAALGSIARTYEFAGKSSWGMIRALYVQIPFAILLVGLLLAVTWRYRKYIMT